VEIVFIVAIYVVAVAVMVVDVVMKEKIKEGHHISLQLEEEVLYQFILKI